MNMLSLLVRYGGIDYDHRCMISEHRGKELWKEKLEGTRNSRDKDQII